MYKLIIFDVDGTIADTDKVILKTYIELYKKFLPNKKIDKKKIITFSGPPLKETLINEFPSYDIDFMVSEYKKTSRKNYILYLKSFRNCKDILLKLKNDGYILALATSKYREATEFTLKLLGFEGIFEYIVCGDEVKHPKPAPDSIEKILQISGFSKSESLFVGDTIYDILCAKSSKVNIAIMSFKKRELSEEYKPDYITNSYKKLYDYIVDYGK